MSLLSTDEGEAPYEGMPRPYVISVDCRVVPTIVARRIMVEIFSWSEIYVDSVLKRIEGCDSTAHPYTTREIAESKLIQVAELFSILGVDFKGVVMKPNI